MDYKKMIIIVWAVLLSCSTVLSAQQSGDLPARLDALLQHWPAPSAGAMREQARELLQLGPEGLTLLCRKLAEPGKGDDDTAVRYALHGLAHTVAAPGFKNDKKLLSRVFATCLQQLSGVSSRAFLLRQFRHFADESAVAAAARFVLHPELHDPAIRLLTSIGTERAAGACLARLSGASGSARIALIRALGEMRYQPACETLLPLASDSDSLLRTAALDALAAAGCDGARETLEYIPVTASRAERRDAVFRLLTYAGQRYRLEHDQDAADICLRVIAAAGPDQSAAACAALSLLTEIQGSAALDHLLAAADRPDRELQSKALDLSLGLTGRAVTASWISKYENADSQLRMMILEMLGKRGDRTAVPVLISAVRTADPPVQRAAAGAGLRLAGDDFFPEVLELLKTADSATATYIKPLILSFTTHQIHADLAGSLPLLPVPARAAALEILAQRRAAAYTEAVFAQTASPDSAVRLAAMTGLAALADSSDIDRILNVLRTAENPAESEALRRALTAAAAGRPEKVVRFFKNAGQETRIIILPVFAELPGPETLRITAAAAESTDAVLRLTAVRTLASWTSGAASPVLLDIARGNSSLEERGIAAGGYIRIAAAYSPDQKAALEMYRNAASLPLSTEQKESLLTHISGIRSMDALRMAARFLDDPETAARASLACASIASAEEGFSGPEALKIMHKAYYLCEDPYVVTQIESALLKADPSGMTRQPIFNGVDLSGWKRHENLPGHGVAGRWYVEDGVLTGVQDPPGQGGFLVTDTEYSDFDLKMKVKIDWPFDSGVFLRVGPDGKSHQVTLDYREGGEIGGIYLPWVRGFVHHNTEAVRQFKEDAWNDLRIVCLGEPCRIIVWLNGTRITDFSHTPETSAGVPVKGRIGLQVHPGGEGFDESRAMFKDITIREIQQLRQ